MLEQYDGFLILTANVMEAATAPNDYFCSIYTRESLSDIPTLSPLNFDGSLSSIKVTYEKNLISCPSFSHLNPKVLINVILSY